MSGTLSKLSQSEIAQRGWEVMNNVQVSRGTVDDYFRFDETEHRRLLDARPWQKDVHFFKSVHISALALLKMVMHARSGGNIEVMGLMVGRADAGSMIVVDAFALPVEGTETRVNAQNDANEYMTVYVEHMKKAGRIENVIGWYHSHPGYGCWLSGIDVDTQRLNQTYLEPWLAVVIDPTRTIAAGQVDLGAFRTYPQGYIPAEEKDNQYHNIPLKKIEDFGTHHKQYYQLKVSYFQTASDRRLLSDLWGQYWVATLSSSPWFKNLNYNIEQTMDVAAKISRAVQDRNSRSLFNAETGDAENNFHKAVKDGRKVSCEALHALMGHIIKKSVFNEFEPVNGFEADGEAMEEAASVDENISASQNDSGDVQISAPVSENAPLAVGEEMNVDAD